MTTINCPSRRSFLAQALATCVMLGCERRRDASLKTFNGSERDLHVTLLVDLSGSFAPFMAEQGHAYQFVEDLLNLYFRNRIGYSDTLVVAQISGNQRALLWEGRPMDLRQEFPSAARFRDFLLQNADQKASLVNEAMVNAINYTLSDPGVANGKTKTALFVLSDMMQYSLTDESGSTDQQVDESLTAFGAKAGVVGLYYVNTDLVASWRSRLATAGLREYQVSSDIEHRPQLPAFE